MDEIEIRRLGHRGDGIGRGPDGADRAVPFTLPGERVRPDPLRIVAASAQRVTPPCARFGTCGGCAVQHAADGFVADWKAGIVVAALAAHGIAAEVAAVHTSPEASRRRAVFAGRRTKKGVQVGFHARASDLIVPVEPCRVVRPELLAALPALERIVATGASRKGVLRLAVTASEAGPDVAVAGGKPLSPDLSQDVLAIAGEAGFARIAWEGEVLATFRPPVQRFGAARVVPPPGAFLQATAQGEAALVDAVTRIVGDAGRVVDLFAGCGTFTLPLAARAEVFAVEGEAAMLTALDAGWRQAAGLRKVAVTARDLFRRPLPAATLGQFDAAVIDPPRAGAPAQVEALAAADLARIAFVSCNPVTFARDAAVLVAAGWRLDRVEVVDQFRWAAHVELVAGFSRR